MKTLTVFLLFLGISFVFTSQVSLKALEKIREDELGEPFVNLIDLNLRLKTPVSEISTLLDGILQALLADRELLQQNYQTQSTILNNAITTGTSLISTYQSTISVLSQSITNDQQTLSTTQTSLQNTQISLTNAQTSLTQTQQDYQTYVPNAGADINDLGTAIDSLKKAIDKMVAYQNSGVEQKIFLQVSSGLKRDMKKVTDQLERMKKALSQSNNMYTPIVTELIDLTSNMTQDKADKIISLLNQLLQLLQNSLNTLQTQLATYKTNYDTQVATLNQNIDTYQVNIAQYNVDITNLQTRIDQSQSDVTTTNQLLSDAQSKLTADQQSLQDLNNNYAVQDDRYKRLIPLIRQVISSFNDNVAGADQDSLAAVDS